MRGLRCSAYLRGRLNVGCRDVLSHRPRGSNVWKFDAPEANDLPRSKNLTGKSSLGPLFYSFRAAVASSARAQGGASRAVGCRVGAH